MQNFDKGAATLPYVIILAGVSSFIFKSFDEGFLAAKKELAITRAKSQEPYIVDYIDSKIFCEPTLQQTCPNDPKDKEAVSLYTNQDSAVVGQYSAFIKIPQIDSLKKKIISGSAYFNSKTLYWRAYCQRCPYILTDPESCTESTKEIYVEVFDESRLEVGSGTKIENVCAGQ